MAWLGSEGASAPGAALRALLARPAILEVPGAHHALAALLARDAGFEALYVSGAAFSASLGLPDVGLVTLDELVRHTAAMARAAGLPLIVDADTGFGGALNVMRTVRELEAAGAAAIQIEDQVMAKKCGHLSDKHVVAPQVMAERIAAACQARREALIIARTDAAAAEGLEGACARARLYREAGADIIFPEALTSAEAFAAFAAAIDAPLLANMTEFGRTPDLSAREFAALGYAIVIWPVSSLRIAAHAIAGLYAHLREHGGCAGLKEAMQSRAALYETIGYADYEAHDAAIARGQLPGPAAD